MASVRELGRSEGDIDVYWDPTDANDGTVACGRILEFAVDLESEVLVGPRGLARAGVTPDGRSGLSVSTFYSPGSVGYMAYGTPEAANTIAPRQVGSWILEICATVDEARARIDGTPDLRPGVQ